VHCHPCNNRAVFCSTGMQTFLEGLMSMILGEGKFVDIGLSPKRMSVQIADLVFTADLCVNCFKEHLQ